MAVWHEVQPNAEGPDRGNRTERQIPAAQPPSETVLLVMLRPMMTLVYAFGAGILAAAVMCCALAATLDTEDRRKALRVIRHPITSIFGQSSAHDADQSASDG